MEENTTFGSAVPSEPIGLSEALAAGAPLSWTEAVAVVRDVAMHLHWSETPLIVPTLAHIAILPNGSVLIEGGHPNLAGPVAGLADLMEQLLDSTGCPQQLLDVQEQARATPPVFDSPQELNAALQYFARPGSQDELASYYRVAATALEATSRNRELEALKEKSKAFVETEKKRDDPGQESRLMLYLTLAFVGVTAIAAALFGIRFGGQAPAVMNKSAGEALSAIGTTSRNLSAAASTMVAEMIGASREPTPAPPPPPPAPVASAPKALPRGAREAGARAVVSAAGDAPLSPTESDRPAAENTDSADSEPAPDLADARIYSPRDSDVQPPELIYQQFPSAYIETVPNAHPGRLVILVLEDGTVAEVKLLPDSNRLQDRLLISAAKAWRFRPATRDGKPVRYRISVPITY